MYYIMYLVLHMIYFSVSTTKFFVFHPIDRRIWMYGHTYVYYMFILYRSTICPFDVTCLRYIGTSLHIYYFSMFQGDSREE